jgi:hypothetical protein
MPVIAKWPNHKVLEFRLHCFRSRQEAETFAAHFEGMHFDPVKDREGGKINGAWIRTDEWRPIERCGPLKVPRFFQEIREFPRCTLQDFDPARPNEGGHSPGKLQ